MSSSVERGSTGRRPGSVGGDPVSHARKARPRTERRRALSTPTQVLLLGSVSAAFLVAAYVGPALISAPVTKLTFGVVCLGVGLIMLLGSLLTYLAGDPSDPEPAPAASRATSRVPPSAVPGRRPVAPRISTSVYRPRPDPIGSIEPTSSGMTAAIAWAGAGPGFDTSRSRTTTGRSVAERPRRPSTQPPEPWEDPLGPVPSIASMAPGSTTGTCGECGRSLALAGGSERCPQCGSQLCPPCRRRMDEEPDAPCLHLTIPAA